MHNGQAGYSWVSFVFIYWDDVFIPNPDLSTHIHHLHFTLKMLHIFGLVMNPAKCLFTRADVPFLGDIIYVDKVAPLPSHLQMIQNFLR